MGRVLTQTGKQFIVLKGNNKTPHHTTPHHTTPGSQGVTFLICSPVRTDCVPGWRLEEGREITERCVGGALTINLGVRRGLAELERPDCLSPQNIVLLIIIVLMLLTRLLHVLTFVFTDFLPSPSL